MEENNFISEETSESPLKTQFTTVTTLSKYLALLLFIALPFIGGWVGYKYSPEKIVEVEKIVIQEIQKVEENYDSKSISEANLPSHNLDTSDWVTYMSDDYGVSFKHNPSWKINVAPGSVADSIMIVVDDYSIVNLGIFHGDKDVTSYVSEALNKKCNGCELQKPRDYMMLDGTKVTEVYAFDTFNKKSMLGDFYFSSGDKVFWLHGDSADDETKAIMETVSFSSN